MHGQQNIKIWESVSWWMA